MMTVVWCVLSAMFGGLVATATLYLFIGSRNFEEDQRLSIEELERRINGEGRF